MQSRTPAAFGMQARLPSVGLLIGLGVAAGCKSDNEIKSITLDKIAVVTGDFDRVEESLARFDVLHDVYEGYIDQAIYEEGVDPSVMNPKVESLWLGTNPDGDPTAADYDAIFVNSGSRGLGAYVYNSVEADDSLLIDPQVAVAVDAFTLRRGSLVVSDWGYDLVEHLWPDQITFLNEADGPDAAQAGLDASVLASVDDPALRDALGTAQLEVAFDFSYWSVMMDVGPDVTVHMSGDITFRSSAGQGALELRDVPLLVSFPAGNGLVILSSFAWKAQSAGVTDTILSTLLEGLDTAGQAADSTEVAP